MDASGREKFKAQLLAEKERLEKELTSFAAIDPKMRDDWDTTFPASAPRSSSMSHGALEEQADIREEFETELAQEQALELRLREVRLALERMANGTFGQCRSCGRPIPEERLLANPAAEYDIEHQPKE
ncbi:MAG: TraR/DksA C4-type zinc finger protein [Patescibacteria group bacterium]